jgi:hypothetical protein
MLSARTTKAKVFNNTDFANYWKSLLLADKEVLRMLARQFAPGSNRPVAARLRLDAAIDDSAAGHRLRKEAGETPQTTEVIGIDRSTGLDLNGVETAARRQQKIDLIADSITEEIQVARQTAIELLLEHIGDHQVLEQSAEQRIAFDLLRRSDTLRS